MERKTIQTRVKSKKAPKPRFPPGAIVSFFPLLAETITEITTGGSGAEERFQASVDLEAPSLEKAVALCRRHGVKATDISHALVQIVTLEAESFPGQLDQLGAEAIRSALTPKIASLLSPPKVRR